MDNTNLEHNSMPMEEPTLQLIEFTSTQTSIQHNGLEEEQDSNIKYDGVEVTMKSNIENPTMEQPPAEQPQTEQPEPELQLVKTPTCSSQLPAADACMVCLNTLQSIFEELGPGAQGNSDMQTSWLIEGIECNVSDEIANLNDLGNLSSGVRLLLVKFFNLLLLKVWRHRRSEVEQLKKVLSRYQANALRNQSDLCIRDQIIRLEQRRSELLSSQLKDAFKQVSSLTENCANIEGELQQLREEQTKLRQQLEEKQIECDNFGVMLTECKAELFRELAKYRATATELAIEQRTVQQLELRSSELEDELLTLRDQFQSQNDQMSITLMQKQEELDTAYELLKHCEEEFALMDFQYNELVQYRTNEVEVDAEIARNHQNIFNLYLPNLRVSELRSYTYKTVLSFIRMVGPIKPNPVILPMTNSLEMFAMALLQMAPIYK